MSEINAPTTNHNPPTGQSTAGESPTPEILYYQQATKEQEVKS